MFRYDDAEQAYYCPQGKRLKPATRTTEKRPGGLELPVIVYRASAADCKACPQQKEYTSNPGRGRVLKRYEGEETLEHLEHACKKPPVRRCTRRGARVWSWAMRT